VQPRSKYRVLAYLSSSYRTIAEQELGFEYLI
jgi:hypothetical protein